MDPIGAFWLGFAAFPAVVAAGWALLALLFRALDKNLGVGGCLVCDQGFSCEIGEYTRLGIWIRSRRHNWLIRSRRWHRHLWANNRWNPYRLPGVADNDGTVAALRRPKPSALRRAWWLIFD